MIGGISCAWGLAGEEWAGLRVAAFPVAAVPESVAANTGVVPECMGGGECAYAERFGGAWVVASGWTADQVMRAVAIMGPRAEREPGIAGSLPASAWALPSCEQLRDVIAAQLGRTDFGP